MDTRISSITFDENFQMMIRIPEEVNELFLDISDDLDAAYKPLEEDFQKKIIEFIDKSNIWYPIAHNRINQEFFKETKSTLLAIKVLSENYHDDIIFGLLYDIDEDSEHGRGLKISSKTMNIIDYGEGEVGLYLE